MAAAKKATKKKPAAKKKVVAKKKAPTKKKVRSRIELFDRKCQMVFTRIRDCSTELTDKSPFQVHHNEVCRTLG